MTIKISELQIVVSLSLIKIFLLIVFLDIPDIPENIKNLRSLQVADFSSNPIPRYVFFIFINEH